MSSKGAFEVVIGLEIHIRVNSASKAFSFSGNKSGFSPNGDTDSISYGLPGTLPVLNQNHIEAAIKLGLSLNAELNSSFNFSRKHYFYPDLPKGYQITQLDKFLCVGGGILVKDRMIELDHIHLEEDAGRLIHEQDKTLIDFNRAGVPLIELVTKPCICSAEEAVAVLASIRKLVREIDVSDADMEKGSLRCDANVSCRPNGNVIPPYKVEIKNLNSFRFLKKAIEYEVERQIHLLQSGELVISETRGYNEHRDQTEGQRSKEEGGDYRFMPEPNLPEIVLNTQWMERLKKSLPEPFWEWEKKVKERYFLKDIDIQLLGNSLAHRLFFDQLILSGIAPKTALNWMKGPVSVYAKEVSWDELKMIWRGSVAILKCVDQGIVSWGMAKTKVFEALKQNVNLDVEKKIAELELEMEQEQGKLELVLRDVIASNEEEYLRLVNGDDKVVGFFVGQLRKRLPNVDGKVISERINKIKNNAR